MKKNLLMTAFLVVSAAFIGCSSDDNLAEIQGGDPVPAKGTPMTVVVKDGSGDATRYTATTTSTLAGFQMWCYDKTAEVQHFGGDEYHHTNTVGENRYFSGGGTWPSGDHPCNLFAIAVNTGSSTYGSNLAFTNPAYADEKLKFTYTVPTKDGDHMEPVGLPVLANVVPTPAIVIDTENIEDLLVAANMNIKESTTPVLSLGFTHALCGVEISARFTSAEWQGALGAQGTGVPDGSKIVINYIALHGLYHSGVLTMNSDGSTWNGTWNFTSSAKNQAYYRYDFGGTPKEIIAQAVASSDEKIKRTALVPANTFLLIPQTITPWDPADYDESSEEPTQGIGSGEADALGVAYIEINCSFPNVNGLKNEGTISLFRPLSFSDTTLKPGKIYKVLININHLLRESGNDGSGELETAFQGVVINA